MPRLSLLLLAAESLPLKEVAHITGADWIQLLQIFGQILTGLFTAWIGLRMLQIKSALDTIDTKTSNVADSVLETRKNIHNTEQKLDGRLSELLEETRLRYFAQGRAEMAVEAEQKAKDLLAANTIAKAQDVVTRAEAEAKVLKAADDKATADKAAKP
jgi:hypothetical protein